MSTLKYILPIGFALLASGVVTNAAIPAQPHEVTAMSETEIFATLIGKIGDSVKSLGVPDELFSEPAFVTIYENPQSYAAAAAAYVARLDVNTHHKSVAAYAMQRLPLEFFLAVVTATADSVDNGSSDIRVLESLAFPPLNWGRQSLIMHFDQPQVKSLLRRLLNVRALSDTWKARIREEILTGKAKQEYLDYMDMIGRPVHE